MLLSDDNCMRARSSKLVEQKLVPFNSEKRRTQRVAKLIGPNLRLVGEGFADSQLKRAPQERAAILNSVTPAIVENQPLILRLHSSLRLQAALSRPATPIHITAFPPSVTSRQPGTRGHLAMACEFHLLCPTVNAT